MTVEKCIDACKADGFTVAGLEYASVDCGNALPSQAATEGCAMSLDLPYVWPSTYITSDSYAQNVCPRYGDQICGGSTRAALLGLVMSILFKGVTGGCFAFNGESFRLTPIFRDSGNYILPLNDDDSMHHMTVDKCTSACRARGLAVALLSQADYWTNSRSDIRTFELPLSIWEKLISHAACGDKMPFAQKKEDDGECSSRCEDGQPCGGWHH
ncbi:1913_t:CDS:2, partial [Acaulospora colombiana]